MGDEKQKDAWANMGCGLVVMILAGAALYGIIYLVDVEVHGYVIGKEKTSYKTSKTTTYKSGKRGRRRRRTSTRTYRVYPLVILTDAGEEIVVDNVNKDTYYDAKIGQRIDKGRGMFTDYVLGDEIDSDLASEYADQDFSPPRPPE